MDFVCGNTLVKVIQKWVISAFLPLHVWNSKCLSRLVAFLSKCFLQIPKMVDQDFHVYMTALLLLDLPAPMVISVFHITHLKDIRYNCHTVMVNSFVIGDDTVCSPLHKEMKYIHTMDHLYTTGIAFQHFSSQCIWDWCFSLTQYTAIKLCGMTSQNAVILIFVIIEV